MYSSFSIATAHNLRRVHSSHSRAFGCDILHLSSQGIVSFDKLIVRAGAVFFAEIRTFLSYFVAAGCPSPPTPSPVDTAHDPHSHSFH